MTTKAPKLPTYDRARDGNPFGWIIRAAAEERARRQGALEREYVKVRERRLQWVPKRDDEA